MVSSGQNVGQRRCVMRKRPWLDRFQTQLAAVEVEMRSGLPAGTPSVAPFYSMIAYHLGWQDASFRPVQERAGKRLRPLLCLLACEAVSGAWEHALPAAAAVELLHNFTLIHDDIEDKSPRRRGRPTVWNQWGIAQAINAGDGLFVLARMALFGLRRFALPPEVLLRAVEVFDQAILRICEGQFLDISFEGRSDVDEAAYTEMIAAKTAALFEAALHLGAVVGRGREEVVEALCTYGRQLGLAFQVQDDLLGIWGDEERTGKPAAADIRGRKLGLPLVYALSRSGEADRDILERVYGGAGPVKESDVSAVLEVLERVASRDYVEQVAAGHHRLALQALANVPAGPARQALEEMAASLLGRQE